MRLLYIHQHFATPRGTSALRSYQMARRMVERGHHVTMLCGRGIDGQSGLEGPFHRGVRRGRVEGIDVIEADLAYSNGDSFLKRTKTFLAFMLRTSKLALTEDYDLILATTTPLTVGLPGVLARWLRHKPFVFEVRDLWPELPRAMGVIRNPLVLWAMSMLEWASYRSANRLIGLSPGIVAGIESKGVAPEAIAMVPNGCDFDLFSSYVEAWQPDGVGAGQFVAIFAGAHGLANGLDAVLDAAAVLRRRGRDDIRICLVGQGMCKAALMERATAESLGNVIFLDPIPKTELVGLFRRADVGLQVLADVPAFYYGTSPNKFFDYIASGLPVINNYPGWLAEMIVEAECGIAVPPASPEAFADALVRLADDREATRAMGARAFALGKQNFSRDALAERWSQWVERALPGKLGTEASCAGWFRDGSQNKWRD